jgi:hypothetical protein
VALRPEPFGALAYHFGNRRLTCATCSMFDSCQGGCMAAKFFTGLPLDGPDPECVMGHGERELAKVCLPDRPRVGPGHSRKVMVQLGRVARV